MAAQCFVPQRRLEDPRFARPQTGPPQANECEVGNAAMQQELAELVADGVVAEGSGAMYDVGCVLGVRGEMAHNYAGEDGVMVDDDWEAAWGDIVASPEAAGPAARLVLATEADAMEEPERPGECRDESHCASMVTASCEQLRRKFAEAAGGLRSRLDEQMLRPLGDSVLLQAAADVFATTAKYGMGTLFRAAATSVGGPVVGIAGKAAGRMVGRNVAEMIAAYAGRVTDGTPLSADALDSFFAGYTEAWSDGLYETHIELLAGPPKQLELFSETLSSILAESSLIDVSVTEALLPPLLRLGAESSGETLAGTPAGNYSFEVEFSGLGASARAQRLIMPTSLGPKDCRRLAQVPGLLEGQTVTLTKLVDVHTSFVYRNGALEPAAPVAQIGAMMATGMSESEALRLFGGDQLSAEDERRRDFSVHAGLELTWETLLQQLGNGAPLCESSVPIVGVTEAR